MDAITFVRLAFLGPAAAILLAYLVPSLRSRFLAYGARAVPSASKSVSKPSPNILDSLAAATVPHSWFTSFYYTCVTCTLLWGADYAFTNGTLASHLSTILQITAPTRTPNQSVPFPRTLLTWLLVLTQGTRRLYESHAFATPSASRMWVGHWALGIVFYSALSTTTWIEGLPAIRSHVLSVADFSITAPSLRTLICLCGFAIASGVQHDCHAYLFSLKNKSTRTATSTGSTAAGKKGASDYTLPSHPAFNLTLTPHYFAECCIYIALTFISAPAGAWINRTMACALVFVVANLGITAIGTKEWYAAKSGRKAVEGRARMVPFVF